MEVEFTHYDITVQYVSHDTTGFQNIFVSNVRYMPVNTLIKNDLFNGI